MKIEFNPKEFRLIRVNETQSRVLFSKEFGTYTGATQISTARMRMNADLVTNEVIEQIRREFGKAFETQANVSAASVENLLFDVDKSWIKTG